MWSWTTNGSLQLEGLEDCFSFLALVLILIILKGVYSNHQFRVSYFHECPHTFHRNPGWQNCLQNRFHKFAAYYCNITCIIMSQSSCTICPARMSQFLTQQDAHLGYRFTAAYVKAVQDSGLLDVCRALAGWIDGWLDLIMMNDILLYLHYIYTLIYWHTVYSLNLLSQFLMIYNWIAVLDDVKLKTTPSSESPRSRASWQ